ncbi:MAG: 2-oxoglutarate ferredoxin oxidoreductase subunit gamma [Planctomycetes bacterium]|nr:2-oxoglutarate ferredoxin oxidoreductase subunit gamma [Planctomycetota bacterium]
MRTEVQVAGFGGQGIVLTGMLLGKAASLHDRREVVLTQSYGPEARGGSSSTNIIISDEPVDYLLVTRPDILVCMFQEAYATLRPRLREDGTLILDTGLVEPDPADARCAGLPATQIADELGRRIVANVVMFGYLVGHTRVVSREAAEKAIASTVKPKTVNLNLKAFATGLEKAGELVKR